MVNRTDAMLPLLGALGRWPPRRRAVWVRCSWVGFRRPTYSFTYSIRTVGTAMSGVG